MRYLNDPDATLSFGRMHPLDDLHARPGGCPAVPEQAHVSWQPQRVAELDPRRVCPDCAGGSAAALRILARDDEGPSGWLYFHHTNLGRALISAELLHAVLPLPYATGQHRHYQWTYAHAPQTVLRAAELLFPNEHTPSRVSTTLDPIPWSLEIAETAARLHRPDLFPEAQPGEIIRSEDNPDLMTDPAHALRATAGLLG